MAHSVSRIVSLTMNGKGHGRKRPSLNVRDYPKISLEEPRQNNENLIQDTRLLAEV
jgi:hypothetical protein